MEELFFKHLDKALEDNFGKLPNKELIDPQISKEDGVEFKTQKSLGELVKKQVDLLKETTNCYGKTGFQLL